MSFHCLCAKGMRARAPNLRDEIRGDSRESRSREQHSVHSNDFIRTKQKLHNAIC